MAKADWKNDLKKKGKEWGASNTFKPHEDENTIRILPNLEGSFVKKGADMMSPVEVYMAHPNVGKDKRFLRCGKDLDGDGKCWLCDVKIPDLEGREKESLRVKADEMKPVRQLVAQVAWKEEDKWQGPKPWYLKVGKKALGNRLLAFITSATRDYDDPINGYNLVLERTGSGMATDYGPLQAEEEASKVPSSILGKLKKLDELVPEYSKTTQENIYFGREEEAPPDEDKETTTADDDTDAPPDNDEGDDPPKKKKKPADDDDGEDAPPKKKKPAEYDLGDDDDIPPKKKEKPVDDDTDSKSDDSDAEPPKKKKKPSDDDSDDDPPVKKKKSAEDDEDDPPKKKKRPVDDDDPPPKKKAVDDDDDDPPPKKKKKPIADDDDNEYD